MRRYCIILYNKSDAYTGQECLEIFFHFYYSKVCSLCIPHFFLLNSFGLYYQQVDTVVICAGQECYANLFDPVRTAGNRVFLIGGAQAAGELDGEHPLYSFHVFVLYDLQVTYTDSFSSGKERPLGGRLYFCA